MADGTCPVCQPRDAISIVGMLPCGDCVHGPYSCVVRGSDGELCRHRTGDNLAVCLFRVGHRCPTCGHQTEGGRRGA